MFHNPERRGHPLSRATRLLLGLWGMFLLCGFAVAHRLEPDPRGFGTHEQLGMPPCTFRELFGISCPSCGMTTSISSFAQARFFESARTNLGGFVLAAACLIQIPWSLASAARNRSIAIDRLHVAAVWMLGLVVGTTLMQWLARLIS
jgi:hypothetical protein